MSTDTYTPKQKVYKYLDHCICNEHEEKNVLGPHGAVDQLQLTDHHIQLDSQKERSVMAYCFMEHICLWHQRALSLLLPFLRTLPHSTHFIPPLSILPLRWKLNRKSHLEWSEQKSEENRPLRTPKVAILRRQPPSGGILSQF